MNEQYQKNTLVNKKKINKEWLDCLPPIVDYILAMAYGCCTVM